MNSQLLECIRNQFLPPLEHAEIHTEKHMPGLQQRHKLEKITLKKMGVMERLKGMREEIEYFSIEAYNLHQNSLKERISRRTSKCPRRSIVLRSLKVLSLFIILFEKCSIK